ncbi:MAG: hypothetical protein IT306_15310 [Chloroflexi bacterium]|nr:hypothetical protein [Chloroflexota bacterium]
MGATAADTQREIEEIRKDVSSAVSELKRRVTRALSPKTYVEYARENPAAILGVGMAGLSLAGVAMARSVAQARRQPTTAERLQQGVASAAQSLTEGAQQVLAAVPSLPIEVRVGTGDAQKNGSDTKLLSLKGSDQGMFKRMIWAGLVAMMMAAGGLVARRASATIWRAAMGEAPPTKNI